MAAEDEPALQEARLIMAGCHKRVKEIAVGIASEAYEALAHDNNFYRLWPRRDEFVQRAWPKFITKAREILASMLNMQYSESVKEEVYDILMQDRSLPKSGKSVLRH